MIKKSLIILSVFCLILFASTICFAETLMQGAENTLEHANNGIHDMVNGISDSAKNAKDGISNMVGDIENAGEDAGDAMRDGMSEAGDKVSEMTRDDGYTATRTSATNSGAEAGTNTIVWIILAVAAAIIVALVWYYGSQVETKSHH